MKKLIVGILLAIAVCAAVVGNSNLKKGLNKKDVYRNSDTYTSLNENAYVGGDAYNYIINRIYFTGYSVIGMGCYLNKILK